MAKISFYEVARMLMEHKGLEANIAHEFVKTMFDIILERLTTDQQVKIRGLGTFKIVDVESRESVSVNTGERILIEGYSKIVFTPDSTMKELINKPFSQFDTVVLNDGVNFDEDSTEDGVVAEDVVVTESDTMKENEVAPETGIVTEDNAKAVEETEVIPVVEKQVCVDETPIPEPSPIIDEPLSAADEQPLAVDEQPTEEPMTVEEPPIIEEEQPTVEEQSTVEEEQPIVEEEETETRLPSHFKPVLIHLIYITVVVVLAGWGGYWYGINSAEKEIMASKLVLSPLDVVKAEKPVAAKPVVKSDTVRKDTLKSEPQKKKTEATEAEQSPADDYAKYAKMDVRVRTGAYVIVGEKGVEKVRQGETVARFSRRMLGEGMECYIEVFNGITADTPLKEGQEIKIPELKLKKQLQRRK